MQNVECGEYKAVAETVIRFNRREKQIQRAQAALAMAHERAKQLTAERERLGANWVYADEDDKKRFDEIDAELAELPRQIRNIETYVRDLEAGR